MTADVTYLRPPAKKEREPEPPGSRVWQCGACGCCAFNLLESGEICCDKCEAFTNFRHFDPRQRP